MADEKNQNVTATGVLRATNGDVMLSLAVTDSNPSQVAAEIMLSMDRAIERDARPWKELSITITAPEAPSEA